MNDIVHENHFYYDKYNYYETLSFLGAVWPIEGQPELVRRGAEILPIRLIGNMMNNIALRGWTLSHPSFLIGISVMSIEAILAIVAIIVLGKLKKDMWVLQK